MLLCTETLTRPDDAIQVESAHAEAESRAIFRLRERKTIGCTHTQKKLTHIFFVYIFVFVHTTAFVVFQRCGADFAVFVNTGQEADGSDSGARPDEAVTWGKIKAEAAPVKVPNSPFVAYGY